jgi:hypothetical protein
MVAISISEVFSENFGVMTDPKFRITHCIFCGSSGLSSEHVWPKWAWNLIPKARAKNHERLHTLTPGPNAPTRREAKPHAGPSITVKARVVCKQCNNGWMSLLESKVRPFLTPLILGQLTTISVEGLSIVARWLVMKFMVIEFLRPIPPIALQSERLAIMQGDIPPTWQLWLGFHLSEKWATAIWTETASITILANEKDNQASPPSFDKNTQSISFGIGNLFVQTIHSTVAGLEYNFQANALRHLWPIRSNLIWPPGPVLSDVAIDDIAGAFKRSLANVPWNPAPEE